MTDTVSSPSAEAPSEETMNAVAQQLGAPDAETFLRTAPVSLKCAFQLCCLYYDQSPATTRAPDLSATSAGERDRCLKIAERMASAASTRLEAGHDDDAAAQFDTATEIARAIADPDYACEVLALAQPSAPQAQVSGVPSDEQIDAIWYGWNGQDIEIAKRDSSYMARESARSLAVAVLAASPSPAQQDGEVESATGENS